MDMKTTGNDSQEVLTRLEVQAFSSVEISPYQSPDALIAPRNANDQALPEPYETLYHHQVALTDRLEQALEMEHTAAEQLRTFNRLKQDFLSNVSHELRTPITAIQGYLSLMEQGALGELSPEQIDALRIALRNTERLNRLVNDVLDFSSLSRGQLLLEGELVDIAEILAEAARRVADAAECKEIRLAYAPVKSSTRVIGDQERLTQMIVHLLDNAIKFSDPGQQVVLDSYRLPHQVAVEIRDQGIGMTQEQLAHVFTPFVQGDSGLSRRYGGLGMGLSLIHNLVALHGGEINITSEPGEGTTVQVTLPLLGQ